MGLYQKELHLSWIKLSKLEEILKEHWGFTSFRPGQQKIIEDVLTARDVIALLPTGGGKSICFQIPSLARPGICIVISPLVALMEDQVKALRNKGIKAMALTGGTSLSDIDTMLDNCIYGAYKFLYLSPERLQQELVQERIRQMQVNLIAVDEAHCISQWGHDFRPAYLNISLLRELKPEAPVIALTASATSTVVKDIATQLDLNSAVVHQNSFARNNLSYQVLEVSDKKNHLKNLLKQQNEPAIVYVRSRKACLEISQFLNQNNIAADAFHGGLPRKDKTERLQKWLAEEFKVMVATSAFGMGIDKANVRQVIHINLPDSLESYFQEAGRAGRDGKPATAVILTSQGDISMLKSQFLSTLPSIEDIKLVYKKLNTYFRIAYGEGEGTCHHFNFTSFCQTYGLHVFKTYNSLLFLDRTSIINLVEHFQKKTRVHFQVSVKQLTYFLEANPRFDPLIKAILRTYGGIFEEMTEINLDATCTKAGTNRSEALHLMELLKKEGVLDYEHHQHDTRITFLVPREDQQTINPLVPHLNLQLKAKVEKIKGVLRYLTDKTTCRSEQLLKYFGEDYTHGCGICSVCLKKNEKPDRDQLNKIYLQVRNLLKMQSYTQKELLAHIDAPEADVLLVIEALRVKEVIIISEEKKLKLKN